MDHTTRILLVDDDAIIALAESVMLRDAGFEVETVHAGERAVERIAEDASVDLVLMDIDLGRGIDGTEAAARILELRTLPIVFLTSHSEKEMVDRVKGITRYGYVLKNSGRFVLVESVTMALELFRAHQVTASRERRIRDLNRTYGVLTAINQEILRSTDPATLFSAACRIAVEDGTFLFAWVGIADATGTRIVPSTSFGDHTTYLESLYLDLTIPAISLGPTASCFRTASHVIVNDIENTDAMAPWKELAASHGFRSSAAFPIVVDGEVYGVFGIYAGSTGFFDEDEVLLLDQLAADLGYALEVARTRDAAFAAERARSEWEHLMSFVIEHDPSSIAVYDTGMRYLYVSNKYLEENQLQKTDVVGRVHYDVIRDTPQKWRDAHRRALGGETVRSEDDFYVRADGTVEYSRWECRPWRRPDGEIGGVILYSEIITRQKLAEGEHRRVLSALRSLLEHSPDLISIVDTSGRWIMVSDSVAEATGVSAEEMEGRRFEELIDGAVAASFGERIGMIVAGKDSVSQLEHIRTPRGMRRFRTTLFPAQKTGGKVNLVGIVSTDLTEESRALEEIELSEARYRSVLETTSFGFWETDERGVVVEANEAYARMSGYSVTELHGMPISELDAIDGPDVVNERTREIAATGLSVFETLHRRKGGTTFPAVVRVNRQNDGSGRLLAIIEDITDRREAETAREQMLAQRELALRESHHRIKNDMQIIEALLSLQADRIADPAATQVLTEAAGRVEAMTQLYDTIYLRRTPDSEPDLAELVTNLVQDISRRYGDTAPDIVVDAARVSISDREAGPLAVIVNELITNAVKHGSRTRPHDLTIAVRVHVEDDTTILRITDNGPGFSEEALAERSDGFGITLVRTFAAQIGGSVTMRNDGECGATVEIRF